MNFCTLFYSLGHLKVSEVIRYRYREFENFYRMPLSVLNTMLKISSEKSNISGQDDNISQTIPMEEVFLTYLKLRT